MSSTYPAFYAVHAVAAWRQVGRTFHLSVHGFRWVPRLEIFNKRHALAGAVTLFFARRYAKRKLGGVTGRLRLNR